MTRQIDNDALDFPTSFESDKRSKKSAREDVNSSLVYLFTLHSWHLVLFFLFPQRTSVTESTRLLIIAKIRR